MTVRNLSRNLRASVLALVAGVVTAAAGPAVPLATADGQATTFSSGIPVVTLDGVLSAPSDTTEGQFQLWEDGGAPSLDTPAEVKIRGNSSADFPKKSYSVELHDATGGSRKVSLLGMARAADWALIAPWEYDRAYLRNAYTYALSNRLGRWAPRTRFVEYFVREPGAPLSVSNYVGLGVLTERIKIASDLLAIKSLSASDVAGEAVTGGYILKFDPPDDDEFAWVTDHGIPAEVGPSVGTKLVVASPKAEKLAPAQQAYIQKYVQDFENALFADRASHWASRDHLAYIDRSSWVDFHLLQVLTKNPDGLVRSAYFHKDRNGKLMAGPVWDFDRAMGSTDPRAERWDEWNEAYEGAQLWETGWWGVLAEDPDFIQAWVDRWQSLRRETLSAKALTALANDLAGQIDPAAAARDAERWPENASRFGGGFREEVDHLAQWLVSRADWIDQQFVAPPVVVEGAGGTRILAPNGGYIAYTTDGSDPRAEGGAPSSQAFLAQGGLLLAQGSQVNVRVYLPSQASGVVSSPWSSAVVLTGSNDGPGLGGNGGTVASLMNLSTRGVVDGAQTLVSGITVTGTAPQEVVVRAIGPGLLRFGVADALADPVVRVRAADGTELAVNGDWRTAPDYAALPSLFASVGAFPLDAGVPDAALRLTLPPGGYTLEVSSASSALGAVLAELYAVSGGTTVRNLSSRSALAPGEVLIGGVNITATEPRRVLVRAVGPALSQFGVSDAAADTLLTVYAGDRVIATNDDWAYAANASEIASAAAATGAFELPVEGADAAVVLSLEPGTYTVQAATKNDQGGAVLLEVYELP